MARYFTRRAAKAFYVEDDHDLPAPGPLANINVPEHTATDTGLLDARGEAIWRAPNPVGFIWKD